ncbi:unnamed protein product [Closterium sp. NIES-64]|nr:unnamed protein product [Closterium sp. NIES-64]
MARRPESLSRCRRVLLVTTSIVAAFFTAGVTFGYSGLLPALTGPVGAFSDACPAGEPVPCARQMSLLNAAYTLSMFTNSASAIVVGLVLDRTGPRRTTLIGTVIFALGLLALAGAGAFAPGAHNDAAPDAATPPSVTNSTDSNSTASATVVVPAVAEPANTSVAAAAVSTQPPRGLMRIDGAWRNGELPLPEGSWAQLTGGKRGTHGAREGARMVKVMGKGGAAREERAGWVEGHACWRRSGGCPGEQVMRGDQGVQRRKLEAEGQGEAGGTAEGSSGGKEAASGVFFFAAFFLLSLGGPFIFTSSVRAPPPHLSPCPLRPPPFLLPLSSPRPLLQINFCVLVPRLSSAIISAQSGAFEASSLILFLLGLAVTRLHLPLSALALAYCLVPLALAALAAAAFPNSPFGAAKAAASAGRGDTRADGGLEDAAAARVRVRGDGGRDGAEVGAGGKEEESEGEGEGQLVLVERPVGGEGGGIGVAGDFIAEDEGIEECLSSSSSSSSDSGGEIGSGGRERKDSVIAMVYSSGSSDDDVENGGKDGGEGEMGGEGGRGEEEGSQWDKGELGRLSPLYWVDVAVSAYLVLRSNFFIAAVNTHIRYTVTTLLSIPPSTATTDLPSDAAAQITRYIDIFNIVLAAGGVVAVPLAGWSMERPGLPFSFVLTTLLCALCSAVQMMAAWVPLPMQLVAFLAFAIARAFIYSTMAAYVGTLFGFRNFGRLYGINRLGGAFLTLLQYPLMRSDPYAEMASRAGRAEEEAQLSRGRRVLLVSVSVLASLLTAGTEMMPSLVRETVRNIQPWKRLHSLNPAPRFPAWSLPQFTAFPRPPPSSPPAPGIIYGYSGILPVLVADVGAFSDACGAGESVPCAAQMNLLNAAYTLSMVTNSACVLPVGAFLDAYGPRTTAITGSLVFSAGLLALALGSAFSQPPPPAPPPALPVPSPSASLLAMPPAFPAYESHHTQSPLLLRPLPPPWPLHYCPHRFEQSDNLSQPLTGRHLEGAPGDRDSAWDGGGMAARGEGARRGGEGIRGMTEVLGWVAGGLRGAKKGVGVAGVCFFAAFFLLALGGPFIVTPMINFSEVLPSSAAAVIAAQSGAFDASAAVLFLFALAVSRLHLALSSVCLAYLAVPLAIAVVAATTFPDVCDESGLNPFGASPASESHATPPSTSTPPSSTPPHPDSLSLLTAPLLQPASEEHSNKSQGSKEQSSQGQSDEDEGERGQARPAVGRSGGGHDDARGEEEGMRGVREGAAAGLIEVRRGDEEGGRSGGRSEGARGPRRSGELERLYLLRLMGASGSDKASAGDAGGASSVAAADELTTSACHVALPAVTGRGSSIPVSPSLPIVWLHGRSTPCLPPPPAIYNADIAIQLRSPLFWVHVGVAAFYVLRSNVYIAAVNDQITFAVHAKAIHPPSTAAAVQHYIDAFNCLLPLGGCLSVPLAGWSIDSLGLPPAFAITAALSLLSSLLLLLAPILPLDAMLLSVAPYSIARACIYSTMAPLIAHLPSFFLSPVAPLPAPFPSFPAPEFRGLHFAAYSVARAFIYSTMAALIASLFGFRNFGRLYGLTRFIGAFAALLQYPLMRYGEEAMRGDFTGMTAGFMACELALATLFPLYLTHCLFGFFWRPKP